MIHYFTTTIINVLKKHFGDDAEQIYQINDLLKYINIKTSSANRGSKARSSFGNIYAIYVLVEDYVNKGFITNNEGYSHYDGAKFTDLLKRQRELPFGSKLQNHALNQRMNEEYKKFFSTSEFIPIIRVVETKRYWINSNLIQFEYNGKNINIAEPILEIINEYIESKKSAFDSFIATCETLKEAENDSEINVLEFIKGLLEPNIDARIFEIVSFAILKNEYKDIQIFWGYERDNLNVENLKLYKTGRTNANDGGIDFVMKPLGRFFQVTETVDVKKYFLDIDKLEKFPVTFVIKSSIEKHLLLARLKEGAKQQYVVDAVVQKYIDCIEEIINIPILTEYLLKANDQGATKEILNEIIKQSKVEFNYEE